MSYVSSSLFFLSHRYRVRTFFPLSAFSPLFFFIRWVLLLFRPVDIFILAEPTSCSNLNPCRFRTHRVYFLSRSGPVTSHFNLLTLLNRVLGLKLLTEIRPSHLLKGCSGAAWRPQTSSIITLSWTALLFCKIRFYITVRLCTFHFALFWNMSFLVEGSPSADD